jgi:hypothetical protein
MPTSGDWAVIRFLIILSLVTYFTAPFTWYMLLLTAGVIYVFGKIVELLSRKD